MRLPDSLLDEMKETFDAYLFKREDHENYFSEHRKSIKLLVDTAVEQSVEGLTGKKPRNPRLARVAINAYAEANELEENVRYVITALNELLSHYHILETKDYIEYEDGIRGFICGQLNEFCASVAALSDNSASAYALVGTLRRVGSAHR